MTPTTIAIVGAGPRALWALEELSALSYERNVSLEVTVFDPREPGVGAAYDPQQPVHRIVNVRSSVITTAAGTLDEYLGISDSFPPRPDVGRFLQHSWQQMVRTAPPHMRIEHVPYRVAALPELAAFDEVLLVTGHAEPAGVPDSSHVPAGATVSIRGAALTFIDLVLDLTVGRGGHFDDAGVYQPSGHEPAKIAPFTRSGAAIQVKPSPPTAAEAAVLSPYRPRIAGAADYAELVDILCAAATDLAGTPVTLADAGPDRAVECAWRASLRNDRRAPQALGFAWRELYPEIVKRVSFGGLDTGGDFYRLTRLLEPLAFGPPPVQIRRLLALVDAGILDVSDLQTRQAADHTLDAVLSPAGASADELVSQLTDADALVTDHSGFVTAHVASVGRASEPYILGHDTLSRSLHDVIPRWARTIIDRYGPTHTHGVPPLAGRVEEWMTELIDATDTAFDLVDTYGSPVNVHDPRPMASNISELSDQGVKVFFARKANKSLVFVDTVRDLGHGVDVASYNELRQVLDRGMDPASVIVSAAIKTDQLLDLAISSGVIISVDSVPELERIAARGKARIAPRLAPDPTVLPPTRFGERKVVWEQAFRRQQAVIEVAGVHCHLHGYAVNDREVALKEAVELVDKLRALGHNPQFVDLGGGVPMSYLESPQEWDNFLCMRARIGDGQRPFTWKSDPLTSIYPFHQEPVREQWLRYLRETDSYAALRDRGVALHLEPGRSVLDGCGMILARVAFVKTRSDGLPLVGVEMNRTQLRTAADDYLVDPLHIRSNRPLDPDTVGLEAYLVGAYCIEDEVIMRRRIRFPEGITAGDLLAFPNTAGYFMHILESASHQIPLARNLVRTAEGRFVPDDIDSWVNE